MHIVKSNPVEQEEPSADFPTFWLLYPRKVARKDAARAWSKLTSAMQMDAVVALVDWRRVWRNWDEQFIPHPATWLNGERFYDELPSGFVQRPSCQADFKPREETPRVAMPQNVRDAIAKLRKSA